MEPGELVTCKTCGSEHPLDFRFCGRCGTPSHIRQQLKAEDRRTHKLSFNRLVVYLALTTLALFAYSYLDNTFIIVLLGTLISAIIDLSFAILQPQVFRLIHLSGIKLKMVLLMILIGATTGLVVFFGVDELNLWLFDEVSYSLEALHESKHPIFWIILLYAVFPALFEELAFRGFVFDNFYKLGGAKSAIIGSSLTFAAIHMDIIGLVWMLPFAFLLGYFRQKYDTIWYGVLIHFTHNFVVYILEYKFYWHL